MRVTCFNVVCDLFVIERHGRTAARLRTELIEVLMH
jgi:hypothetical protein